MICVRWSNRSGESVYGHIVSCGLQAKENPGAPRCFTMLQAIPAMLDDGRGRPRPGHEVRSTRFMEGVVTVYVDGTEAGRHDLDDLLSRPDPGTPAKQT